MRFEEFKAMEEEKKKKRNVLVGIRIDSHSREVLSWALVKVAEPGDCVVAVHVCRSCDNATTRNKPLLDDYLEVYQGLCIVKKVELTGQILTGSSVRKVLANEAKNYDAVALVLGIKKQSTIGSSVSTAKYCAKRLPLTTDVMAIHNGRVVFRRCTSNHLPGLEGDPRPSVNTRGCQSEFGDSEFETETVFSFGETTPRLESDDLKSDCFSFIHEESKAISRSDSLLSENYIDQKLGWPLLKKANSGISQSPKTRRNVSVVQWVMSLPDRSPIHSTKFSTILETPLEMEINDIVDDNFKFRLSAFSEIPEGLENLLQNNSSCKWFSLDVLKSSTSEFSSENLIGNGGCNRVYKGTLPDGKPVAVKILNSSKEAWKDFALEFDIISSLKHKHITPLIGICIEENALISVYDFLPSGSLEENLHGKNNNKEKGVLSWEVRYNVAVGIAEALNYLHKECPQPVIHRDVKSSNILLADGFDPKLSDFGLAIWGPTTSSFLTEGDVVGTFGYLAPEYFMFGKVSDKIDVYAFGVVLLELLSGKRPIGCDDTSKEQESLVMWAKPMLESGDVKGLLDPDLDGKVDEFQMQRMLLAANLCLTRSARLRPTTSQILKLLKGDKDFEKWVKFQKVCEEDMENQEENDDEVYPSSSAELHLSLALLDVLDDDTTSFTSTDPSNSISFEEYLKGRWSRSSSFDN